MLFDYDFVIPANTLQAIPITQNVKLLKGRITRISVFFPPGCAMYAHVAVRHNLYQILPANPEGTLNYDDIMISSELDFPLIDNPFEVTLYGWSDGAKFQHTLALGFDMQPLVTETWEDFNARLFEGQNA